MRLSIALNALSRFTYGPARDLSPFARRIPSDLDVNSKALLVQSHRRSVSVCPHDGSMLRLWLPGYRDRESVASIWRSSQRSHAPTACITWLLAPLLCPIRLSLPAGHGNSLVFSPSMSVP